MELLRLVGLSLEIAEVVCELVVLAQAGELRRVGLEGLALEMVDLALEVQRRGVCELRHLLGQHLLLQGAQLLDAHGDAGERGEAKIVERDGGGGILLESAARQRRDG